MKQKLFILLCFTGLIPVAVSILRSVLHKYDLIMTPMTWPNAQNHCRMMYDDLATILSETDWLRLNKITADKVLLPWSGLYNDIDSWRWSLNSLPLKNVTFTNWFSGQPNNYAGKESCVAINMYGQWADFNCVDKRPFICYNASFSDASRFVGINNPQLSWFSARAYCRTHHTDLASSLNSSDNNYLWNVRNIQGDSWIGLYRDTWKWSDGTNASNIPWYPGQPDNYLGNQNCAVVNNGLFRDEPCIYRKYFYCHTIFPTRSQIIRLQVKSDGSVFDPAVQLSMIQQIKWKLKEKGMLENINVTWKVQPDGKIFHKKK